MSEIPEIGGKRPIPVKVEAGKSYWWCAAGAPRRSRSATARTRARLRAARIQAAASEEAYFCTCKRSANKPLATAARLILQDVSNAMPELLLELFSEEIPARMQARAAEDLRKLVTDRLVDGGPRL